MKRYPKFDIYVEGGGHQNKALVVQCKQGFGVFFDKLDLERKPSVKPCGGRKEAFDDFCTALKYAEKDDVVLLLVDSEDQVNIQNAWEHLRNRPSDGWKKPERATEEQAHLMVRCMEAWFLADREALALYFKKDFRESALPSPHANVESIERKTLQDALENAARDTIKETYSKGRDSFAILGLIDPAKLGKASSWAGRFIQTVVKYGHT